MEKLRSRVIGTLFLSAMLAYGFGFGLVESTINSAGVLSISPVNRIQFTFGTVLMLANSGFVIAIALMVLPLLKRHSTLGAYFYLCTRIVESTLLAFGTICMMLILTTSDQEGLSAATGNESFFKALSLVAVRTNFFAYQIAMLILGIGSLLFCLILFRAKMVPSFLAIWGFLGYFLVSLGALLEIFGLKLGVTLSIPGGLFELFFGFWLIFKGFQGPQAEVKTIDGK